MLAAARHDWLVFSDSDMHVPPDYVRRLVDALAVPGTGLITTLSAGLPTAPGLGARLGAMHVTYSFLPAVLLARALGRQDCLGTTMALRRETLERIGGLEAVATYLAEDNVVGQKVRALGLGVGLADTIPATAVAERGLRPLWQRELRWARTIRSLEPCGFAASMLQFPLFWAVLLCLLTAGSALALAVLAVVWLSRAAMMVWIARMLRRRGPSLAEFLLSPLRDIMSVAQIVVSFAGSQVVWRGHVMRADRYRGPVLSNHGNEVH
jgi:ceramide glucosyltransferase